MSGVRELRERVQARDAGLTLVELLVSMGIFSIVVAVFIGGLVSMSRSTVRGQDVTDAGDDLRKAFQTMDKQIRYASSINFPGVGVSGSHYVEFVTKAQPNGQDPLCTQWRFDPTARTLATRTWRDVPSGVRSAWVTVASDVRNDLTGGSPDKPFVLTPAGGALSRQQLRVSLDAGRGAGGSGEITGADITTVFVARNSSESSLSNQDLNNDKVSDTPACSSHMERL